MKKIIACMLIMVMILCNSIVVLAEEANVTATFTSSSADVISADIAWGDLSYTYSGTVKWNEAGYYVIDQSGSWKNVAQTNSTTVSVTNKSEKAIKSTITYAADNSKIAFSGSNGGKLTNSGTPVDLGSKAVDPSATVLDSRTFTVTGNPDSITATSAEIAAGITFGTITITVE